MLGTWVYSDVTGELARSHFGCLNHRDYLSMTGQTANRDRAAGPVPPSATLERLRLLAERLTDLEATSEEVAAALQRHRDQSHAARTQRELSDSPATMCFVHRSTPALAERVHQLLDVLAFIIPSACGAGASSR
jgi:hypothetical protein